MDDAFAGGVCRCQHCGTIQTVPSHLKPDAGRAVKTDAAGQKALYKSRRADGLPGTGLDDLATAVQSSGLSGLTGLTSSGLRHARKPAGVSPAPSPRRNTIVLISAIAAALVLGIIITLIAVSGGKKTEGAAGTDSAGEPAEPGVVAAVPEKDGPNSIAGIKLGASVAYVVDRGSGSQNVFGAMQLAVKNSIAGLDSKTRFQVVYWRAGGEVVAIPPSPKTPDPDVIQSTSQKMDDLGAFGASDLIPSLNEALAGKAQDVVIMTGKDEVPGDTFTKANNTLKARKSNARVHVISYRAGSASIWRQLSDATGGRFVEIR